MNAYEVEGALNGLISADLREGSDLLLGTLGYRSERTLEKDGTWKSLVPLNTSLTKKEDAAREHFQSGAILFQFTGEEMTEQTSLFKAEFEEGRETSFLFLCAELKERSYTRSELASLVRVFNKVYQMPTIVLFRYGRLATLGVIHQRAHKKDDDRNVLEKVTLIKDISLENPHRAHVDILTDLSLEKLEAKSFDALLKKWQEVLDTSELNKRFYKELVAWFRRACDEVKFPSPEDNPMSPQEHVIRMICRLLFIWFIKEKKLVPDHLFKEKEVEKLLKKRDCAQGTNYYTAILQNLFFATLNTEIDKRAFSEKSNNTHRVASRYRYRDQLASPDDFRELMEQVPFINGGLFECLDLDEASSEKEKAANRIDCFTDNKTHQKFLRVPNSLFFGEEGLFKLFKRYKFTVEENTPVEEDVALDPELLGITFENLLAEYNPETQDTARKQTGSYYTPRAIVDYMVDEALTVALSEKVEPYDKDKDFLKERLHELFDYGAAGKKNASHLIDDNEVKPLIKAISELKILDPAVGSGAFPMGVLNKLVLALETLDPKSKIWHEMQKMHAQEKVGDALDKEDKKEREEELKIINETFGNFSGDFGRKLFLIQNNIFGVDIQTTACQIAKLRVFISLAIEQEGDGNKNNNYGIRPLPNLETRFVAANTLIGLGKKDEQMELGSDKEVVRIERELKRISELYFNARTRDEKRRYRGEDKKHRQELAGELKSSRMPATDAERIADWSPFSQISKADWFSPEWMFGVKDDFDIVIGNPPYVRQEKIENKAEIKESFDTFFNGTADIYTYFYKKGGDMLKDKGVLCFITSNKFMRAAYGEKLREFLTTNLKPVTILDFGSKGIFDATTRPLIYLGQKESTRKDFQTATAQTKVEMLEPGEFITQKGFILPIASLSKENWALLPPNLIQLGEKIKTTGKSLQLYLKDTARTKIYRGITTGLNEAFYIDEATKERLIKEDPKSAELIRPLLRGSNLKKWRADWQKLYVIFTRYGTDIKKYPAIEKYLSAFRKKLEPKNKPNMKEGRKKGLYKWYEIQDNTAYYAEFDKPKIIYPTIGTEMRATLDNKKHLINDAAFFIPKEDKYLIGVFNSQMMDFFYRLNAPNLDDTFNGGDISFKGYFMDKLPIAAPDEPTRRKIETLVDKIHAAKKSDPSADVSALETHIDTLIYQLYNITQAEKALIESATTQK